MDNSTANRRGKRKQIPISDSLHHEAVAPNDTSFQNQSINNSFRILLPNEQ